ncbi:flagellar hook-associated protein FlgK [Rhodobacter maris]|uniref:Flagellar hook-associated protein 1 n=1 Tax=Rhodobacter maris TaxID=446682 RepID=A0A285SGB1_9RHOB|nr:flagellar hook-associated protein FlgK [Rhodobacter maris]SOC06715.1 flagellar hook-associated protein 1 FlgK [Rhodobacter maris]
MGINNAFNNAVSGLTASSRKAEIVSANVANAMTEGYARRELSISAETLGGDGGGVRILGVNRIVDATLLQDKQLADAAAANIDVKVDFFANIEAEIGDPTEAGSLGQTISDFENALLEASSMPDSVARLTATVTTAQSVVSKINAISDEIQASRLEADHAIGEQVDLLNESLVRIDELNHAITSQLSTGRDASALMDERQMVLDQIAEIVPIKVVDRDNNQISIFTKSGAILLDGSPSEIGFSSSSAMDPGWTLESGTLSGLTLNGQPVSTAESGMFGGGSLAANFAIRDELAPEAQANLDAVARDLMTRLESVSVDDNGAGLFTDAGEAFDAANETGLAGRLRLNASVDPSQEDGAVWRIRDGLDATSEGAVGNATLLNAISAALSDESAPASGNMGSTRRSFSGLAAGFLSIVASDRQSAELTQSYTSARQESLNEMVLGQGVDTDYELQNLLVIEQAYAANAKVISAIDSLLQEILDL